MQNFINKFPTNKVGSKYDWIYNFGFSQDIGQHNFDCEKPCTIQRAEDSFFYIGYYFTTDFLFCNQSNH